MPNEMTGLRNPLSHNRMRRLQSRKHVCDSPAKCRHIDFKECQDGYTFWRRKVTSRTPKRTPNELIDPPPVGI